MKNNSNIDSTDKPAGGAFSWATLPGRLDRSTKATSLAFNWVACGAMVAMMLLATVDLVGIKVFRWRFAGAFEVIGLLGLISVAFAISYTQVKQGHVAVDFVTTLLPKRAQAVIDSIIPLIALVIFTIMTWQMFAIGQRFQTQGGVTTTERIPTAPFAYATVACALLMCVVLVVQFVKAIKGAIKWKTMPSD